MKARIFAKVGDIFNRFTILSFAHKNNKRCAVCECICGTIKSIDLGNLIYNRSKSCGCFKNEQVAKLNFLEWYDNIPMSYFNSLKRGAVQREIEFTITPEDVNLQWIKQNKKCALTGIELVFANLNKKYKLITASVDRINSDMGYLPDNIQIVHKDINKLKNTFSQDSFINWCRLVAKTHPAPEGSDAYGIFAL